MIRLERIVESLENITKTKLNGEKGWLRSILVLCIMEFKVMANLCVCYQRYHLKCIGLGLVDIAITQAFIHIGKFMGVCDLHMDMVF